MRWYGYNVVMLVAYVGVLVNCSAFLARGWRFPGTFRKPEGARLRAWAGVCLAVALLQVVFVDAATNGLNDFSGAIGRWLGWLVLPPCILILAAFVLIGIAVRASIRSGGSGRRADGTATSSARARRTQAWPGRDSRLVRVRPATGLPFPVS